MTHRWSRAGTIARISVLASVVIFVAWLIYFYQTGYYQLATEHKEEGLSTVTLPPRIDNAYSEMAPSRHVEDIQRELSAIKTARDCLACQPQEPVKEFCRKYPGRHGCPSYVMTGVMLQNTPGYVKFTASVLRKYNNIAEEDIHLFNDGFDKINTATAKKWYGEKVQCFWSDTTTGIPATTTRILKHFVDSKYQILLLIDSDMILLKDWFNFIEDHISQTDGFLSLYHPSVNHSYASDCDSQLGDLCVDDYLPSSGVAMTKSFARAILTQGDDSVRYFYPTKSLAMRISQKRQDSENCGTNEVAYRFNRCEYPNWIRDQIEFYFDRCTSPDEIYPDDPQSKEFKEKMQKRFWVRPAVSYSFYGSRTRYLAIALGNVARVSSVYPGWKIWVYHDSSVPDPVLQTFCEYDVRMIDLTNTKLVNQMSWRFLVASEPVKMWAIRDIDSHLLPRGKAAVDQWIASGKKFHILRDHPNHSAHPINGGSWGGRYDAMPSMKEELEKYSITNAYMEDMNFLRKVVWPVAEKSAWINDAYSRHIYGEDHPFPTKLTVKWAFVCNVILWPEK